MNVTEQINRSRQMMGGTGNTNPAYYSSSKSLNYSKSSNSLLNAREERVTAIPSSLNYQDSVGLFGAENVYIKVQLDIENTISIYKDTGSPVNTYFPATIDVDNEDQDLYYEAAFLDFTKDLFTENDYEPAVLANKIDTIPSPLVSIDLANLKTGNKYIDAWFDVRLYTKDRMEHAYDKMYIPPTSFFYIGFHARNTKRLPYNVRVIVGDGYFSSYDIPASERRYIVS